VTRRSHISAKELPAGPALGDLGGNSGVPLRTPTGMGDLLPPEANARRALSRVVLQTFELCGYDLITTPLFEHAEVVERGADALDPRDLLRFVEPGSGEVAVLRPDITPQIARVIATRMADHPAPWRLCYEGRVIRRRRGRARSHQQVSQAGVECVGIAGIEADAEVVMLAQQACVDAGLRDFRIELSQVTIAQSLLDTLPKALQAPLAETLARKDHSALAALCSQAHVPAETTKNLLALIDHYGELDVVQRAEKRLRWPAARAALRNLQQIIERLATFGVQSRLCVDLSDARGSSYYTGISFRVLAAGPGEPIGAGGRYDTLLSRYGTAQPATGFAFDLENLQWALRDAGAPSLLPTWLRLVVAGGSDAQRHALAAALRSKGAVAAVLADATDVTSSLAFARAWGYDAAVVLSRTVARVVRAADATEKKIDVTSASASDAATIVALKRWAQDKAREG
jgi:ATP phosphoribosyltransferase regulatory subunit